MSETFFTALTFSPVQDFIEKSRKLRDLYGSSLILSYLADELCRDVRKSFGADESPDLLVDPVISPAQISVARGTPNIILVKGLYPKDRAQDTLNRAWKELVESCRRWIEATVPPETTEQPSWRYVWKRPWQEWGTHCWEFFWATGSSIDDARANMNQAKYARAWTGINWVGESSTLSGLDSRAWHSLGLHKSHERSRSAEEAEVRKFYTQLSQAIEPPPASANGNANGNTNGDTSIITPREQLSIPELVKRLVTIEDVLLSQRNQPLASKPLELPKSFNAINRWKTRKSSTDATSSTEDLADGTEDAQRASDRQDEDGRWTGWFQGDGDRAGKFLETLSTEDQENRTRHFSYAMRQWGACLPQHLPVLPASALSDRKTLDRQGRIIYAGGDDFLGVLYRNAPRAPLTATECLDWFYRFKPDIWRQHQQPISVSVGLVWAAPNVPQRDVLQHCRQAEKAAKNEGRDRIALRILFNGGNHLEWVCPWRFLPLLQDYRDRSATSGQWTHLYNDVATLEARHAFEPNATGSPTIVALRLFQVYFQREQALRNEIAGTSAWEAGDRDMFYDLMSADALDLEHPALWNDDDPNTNEITGGILGDRKDYESEEEVRKAFNQWIIDLAKVGFHLCRNR
ncbi:Cas10/Cmr2 second palm domain-containing protein [Vacuolonema iberomarrocanum]|uniref:Cas10/Cmr2 second palm domain-containing protein n=1 Tax=Vacuolonema iberomarrocanum TaxID=3454632 RepID=UPI0019F4F5F3|nr:CRISPR-associated protein Cas10 [filamentous cyanobacterium LEGE 07170]